MVDPPLSSEKAQREARRGLEVPDRDRGQDAETDDLPWERGRLARICVSPGNADVPIGMIILFPRLLGCGRDARAPRYYLDMRARGSGSPESAPASSDLRRLAWTWQSWVVE